MGKKDNDTAGESGRDEEESRRTRLRVMNERFESRLDETVFEGVRDEAIYHGMKLASATALHKPFADICFCEETQEFLVLDKGTAIHRYSMQGKNLQPSCTLDPAMSFERMLWCAGSGWLVCHDAEYIWLLTSGFTGSRQGVKCEFRIKAVHCQPTSSEIVVVGTLQAAKYSLDKEHRRNSEPPPATTLAYIDPEFGPNWQLDCSSLIPASAASTYTSVLVASYLTTLYLMPLEVDSDADTEGALECLKRRVNASKAPITAIHFHVSSAWVVTGDQQGNVVAWNLDFDCMMSHSEAHENRVTTFVPHPSICGFLSYSTDGKLQAWSCNFRGKIESFKQFGAISGISVVPSAAMIVVLGTKLFYLTMRQMYCFYAPLTGAAKWLTSTKNPMYATKVVAASGDNSVRLFSAKGRQLNVQILPAETLQVVSAVYSGNENNLFTIILKSGEILVSDTTTNPMKFRTVFVNDGPSITCITVYEYFDEIRNEHRQPQSPRIFYPIRIQIIAGTEKGDLILINNVSGKHEDTCPAHTGSVIQLQSSIIHHHVVSLGMDKCVKVWRIFADLSQPLALYYTLYFTIPITRIASMGQVLCMVNSSENSKVHTVLMDNMKERMRLEHHPSKDHTATVVNMITSEALGLCATSSLDNTIRIWDEQNCLQTILEINVCALNMTFSSLRGDIVFSAGRHLYQIPYKNYLSPKYRAKIVGHDIHEEVDEESVPEDPEYKIYDDTVDRNSMLHPVTSTPLLSIDINSDHPKVDLVIQKQNCALYEYRDEDVRKIKDNLIEPPKLSGDRALMTTEVWNKYVNDLLNSMTRPTVETPAYDFHNIRETNSTEEKAYNERGIFQMLFGYSIDELEESDENLPQLIKTVKLPLHGFLPNSVLYKHKEEEIVVIEEEEPVVKEPVKYRYPRQFYPEEEEEVDVRRSIRLSELMMVGPTENGGEETA